jgi:hypothetical protein
MPMPDWTFAAQAAGLAAAVLAALLGAQFLLASRRLGGLTVLRLAGVGFLALAAACPLLAPSIFDPEFNILDSARLFLTVTGFSAIGLGYLLRARHGDSPEPGYGLAYQAFLVAGAAAVAPFAAFAVLHPLLREVDEAAYVYSATLAAVVGGLLLRRRAGTRALRPLVALGFALLAANQVVLGIAALETPGWEPVLVASGEATLLASLVAFAATLLLERREAQPP